MEGGWETVLLVLVVAGFIWLIKWLISKGVPKVGVKIPGGLGEHWLSIVILVIGIVLAFWAYKAQPRPSEAGTWAWQYWLFVTTVIIVLQALIAINATKLGEAAGYLRTTLWWSLPILLVLSFFGEDKKTAPAAKASSVVLVSSPKETWPEAVLPPTGRSPFIHLDGKRIHVTGDGYYYHVVYRDGRECTSDCTDGSIAGVYLVNTLNVPNKVSWAFAPMN